MKTKQYLFTDEQLVERLKQGDKKAMTELYMRYYMVVFNKCLAFTKNTEDASDLTHDIMLRVMEKIQSFNGASKFSTWLYSITFNYCIDQKRKGKGRFLESLDGLMDVPDFSIDENDAVQAGELTHNYAAKVLSEINRDDHQLLMMKYLSNNSILDLQKMYALSASAVKMRLMRARERAVNKLKIELAA